jgi:cell division transport system ATP-binding protein
VIQFFHVYKSYGRPPRSVLEDISFGIDKGEMAVLYGPTGSGKSTLLRLLFGLESADSGQILALGRNVLKLRGNALPLFRRNIGFVFQDFKLFPKRTVFENIALAMKIAGATAQETQRRTKEVLLAVGLERKHALQAHMLSAGEQQRVCIARAIVNHPAMLLADEPTGNLDSDQAKGIFALLREINTMGTTVIFSTHHPEIVEHLRSRVIHVKSGKITETRAVP